MGSKDMYYRMHLELANTKLTKNTVDSAMLPQILDTHGWAELTKLCDLSIQEVLALKKLAVLGTNGNDEAGRIDSNTHHQPDSDQEPPKKMRRKHRTVKLESVASSASKKEPSRRSSASNKATNSSQNTPLMKACQENDDEQVMKLLSHCKHFEARRHEVNKSAGLNYHNFTAAHYAAEAGAKDCLLLLLQNGALVDAVDRSGRTPLMLASTEGHTDCVSLLLQHGASRGHSAPSSVVSSNGGTGCTALMLAVTRRHVNMDVIDLLLTYPGDNGLMEVDVSHGATALHIAEHYNRISKAWAREDVIQRLLEAEFPYPVEFAPTDEIIAIDKCRAERLGVVREEVRFHRNLFL